MRFIRTGLFIALSCLPAFRCEQAIAQVSSVVTLPAWLDEDRALAHTGLGQGYSPYSSYTGQNPDLLTKRDAFRNGSREMLYLGAPSYTRHIKTDWRPPIFNSLLPQGFLENKEDYVSLFESLSPDSRIVGYYWDGGEGLADGGPNSLLQGYSNLGYNWHMPSSWLCKTLAGDFILNGASDGKARGYHADFSNLDYRDFVLERLLELVDRGVNGFYFDERHFPANREAGAQPLCFGSRTQDLYQGIGGIMPTSENDLNYGKYTVYQGKVLSNFVRYLRTGLKQRRPGKDIPIIFSGTYLPAFTLPHMSLTMAREANSTKIEYIHSVRDSVNDFVFKKSDLLVPPKDIRLAMGIALVRDAADGRPPTVWTGPTLSRYDQLQAFISSVLAYGGIVQLHVPEPYLAGLRDSSPTVPPPDTQTLSPSYTTLHSGFRYLNSVRINYGFTRPYHFAAIHLSERIRNRIYSSFSNVNYEATIEVWKQVVWPATAAYGALVRAGLPVTFITDEQILEGGLSDYSFLFTLDAPLAADIKDAIRQFESGANHRVYSYRASTSWINDPNGSPNQSEEHLAQFQQAMDVEELKASAPISVVFPPNPDPSRHPHATFLKTLGPSGKLVVSLLNDFAWTAEDNGRVFPSPLGTPDSPIKGAKIFFKSQPQRVVDVFTGAELSIVTEGNRFFVRVPGVGPLRIIEVY